MSKNFLKDNSTTNKTNITDQNCFDLKETMVRYGDYTSNKLGSIWEIHGEGKDEIFNTDGNIKWSLEINIDPFNHPVGFSCNITDLPNGDKNYSSTFDIFGYQLTGSFVIEKQVNNKIIKYEGNVRFHHNSNLKFSKKLNRIGKSSFDIKFFLSTNSATTDNCFINLSSRRECDEESQKNINNFLTGLMKYSEGDLKVLSYLNLLWLKFIKKA